jgi:hypothetical protein
MDPTSYFMSDEYQNYYWIQNRIEYYRELNKSLDEAARKDKNLNKRYKSKQKIPIQNIPPCVILKNKEKKTAVRHRNAYTMFDD